MSTPEDEEYTLEDYNDLDCCAVEELLADEVRDAIDSPPYDARIPVRCVVNGHEFQMYRGLTHCRHCGQDQYDEIASTGVRA
jgi:hypothetical protein